LNHLFAFIPPSLASRGVAASSRASSTTSAHFITHSRAICRVRSPMTVARRVVAARANLELSRCERAPRLHARARARRASRAARARSSSVGVAVARVARGARSRVRRAVRRRAIQTRRVSALQYGRGSLYIV
jgi:hypothetical protein